MPFKYAIALLAMLSAYACQAAPLPMEQAAPGIYVHHGKHEDIDAGYSGDICNIGFIVGEAGVAVIDSGGSLQHGRELREAVRQVTDLPILYVINTHVHPDHVFGNAAFLEDKPVFVGHHKLAGAMAQRHDAYMRGQEQWLGPRGAGSTLIPPGMEVRDPVTLDLGGRSLLLTAYPTAHTSTDLTVFDSATSTLWTGDLLFIERIPSIDGDIKGWLQVIDTLRALPVRTAIPGHGPITQDMPAALDQEKRYLATLLEDVRAAIRQGKSMSQAMDSAARTEQANWVLFDVVNRRNVNLIFPALEWE